MRRKTLFRHHPSAGDHAKTGGIRAPPPRKARTIVHGARIGSISQANRVAQSARDARV